MAETAKQHIDRIFASVEGGDAAQRSVLSMSWVRCANTHGVDPASRDPPQILTVEELRSFREPIEQLIDNAQDELDELYKVVRHANYVVLLCNRQGVVIDHRGNEAEAACFRHWGTWLGGVWSEALEGTNAIGTTIAEGRPVTVHREQHYRARHIDLSCSAAPIFGSDGEVLGVLDVSCVDPTLSEHSHALTGALTITTARAIEERLFRDRFRREWIIAVGLPDEPCSTMLLAVDRDQRIIGVDRIARDWLADGDCSLETGTSLWTIFQRDRAAEFPKAGSDAPTQLLLASGGTRLPALITPPTPQWGNWQNDSLHLRPRFRMLGSKEKIIQPQARGGLPPAMLRRVRVYVESHMDENIDLDMLASTVGLSRYHFARSFKQSEGITPHAFLLKRRLESAQELLLHSTISLSEIALAVGFADQSHFTRRFRQWSGVSPGEFRKRQL